MPIRAVLFDIGGPIDTEEIFERLIDQDIVDALRAEGIPVSSSDLAAATEWAIEAFAPNAYRAIIWRLAGGDRAVAERAYATVAARAGERHRARGGIEWREGIGALIAQLHAGGLALGLASNQSEHVIAELDETGIRKYFAHRASEGLRFHKPDVRAFLQVCEELGVLPEDCVMVGDRVDNDIVPAKLLGMRTVLFRTGRHARQQPRALNEVPDAEVRTVSELAIAIQGLIAE
jgi:putative hydrolase of the HAD superfamily